MRAHDRGVIVAADAGEFERELIVGVQPAPAALVAAEQRVGAGADDEFVGGIIAAAGEDRVMHRGEDFALVGAGARRRDRGAVGEVGEARRLAHEDEFLGRLGRAQARDEAARRRPASRSPRAPPRSLRPLKWVRP